MKSTLILFILVLTQTAFAQYTKENLSMASVSNYAYQNLKLYPIRANQAFQQQHRDVGNYKTLQESLKEKKLKITESSKDGDVNTLFIENVSNDTIMVLAGEVIQGGKQDRVISNDFIIYPKSGKKDLDVFCVESGRWQQNGTGSDFNTYYTISTKEVRKAAAVEKEQGKVWEKVAETTQKNNVSAPTNALTAMKDANTFKAELKTYTSRLRDSFRDQKDVIGVVAVSGKTILGCDMFATHDIFMSYYPNLLDSYATEAITSGGPVTVSYEQVDKYLMELISDESKQDQKVKDNGTMLKEKGRKYHISTF
ncbi:MAG TPA: DUF6569 family protein [Cyclobacteriaceae bacterium]|nr:DUF6569 family protein [Cyclobacteriaceae bacterium]